MLGCSGVKSISCRPVVHGKMTFCGVCITTRLPVVALHHKINKTFIIVRLEVGMGDILGGISFIMLQHGVVVGDKGRPTNRNYSPFRSVCKLEKISPTPYLIPAQP